LVAKQKWPDALALVEKARQSLPNDPELLVWAAVLAEQSGNAAQAKTSLAQAQQKFVGSPAAFWTLVGNRRLQVGNWDGADQAAQQALVSAPQDAEISFLLGNVANARGDTVQANAFFSKTIALAGDANPSLAALVRVRMGYETQKVAPLPAPIPAQPITQTLTPKAP
jgi:tetratricopeptide (TPR) repeat protein